MGKRFGSTFLTLLTLTKLAATQSPEYGSADVNQTAQLIGVTPDIDQLQGATTADNNEAQRWKNLALHQRIYERVTVVQLQIDATTAAIDNEIARCAEVQGYLTDRRDRSVTRANLLSALLGGGLGATSAGLQLSSKQVSATVATGLAGGAAAAGLAVYGIHAQRGRSLPLDIESNMLAPFFARPELPAGHYPDVVWRFLMAVAPTDPDHLVRRDRLLRTWIGLKRIDSPGSPASQAKIDRLTSRPSEHLGLLIDDLEDRAAMLQDVRAKLSYLKRDLATLLAALPNLL